MTRADLYGAQDVKLVSHQSFHVIVNLVQLLCKEKLKWIISTETSTGNFETSAICMQLAFSRNSSPELTLVHQIL